MVIFVIGIIVILIIGFIELNPSRYKGTKKYKKIDKKSGLFITISSIMVFALSISDILFIENRGAAENSKTFDILLKKILAGKTVMN